MRSMSVYFVLIISDLLSIHSDIKSTECVAACSLVGVNWQCWHASSIAWQALWLTCMHDSSAWGPTDVACYLLLPNKTSVMVGLFAGQWTSDSHVVGLSPGWAPLRTVLGQATYTCMPLSSSSIIWYQPRGVISLAGKVTTGLVESNGSLPPPTGFMTKSPADWLPRNQDRLWAQARNRVWDYFTYFLMVYCNYYWTLGRLTECFVEQCLIITFLRHNCLTEIGVYDGLWRYCKELWSSFYWWQQYLGIFYLLP